MRVCVFENDNSVRINLPADQTRSTVFSTRTNHEVLFRRINTALINENTIDKSKNFIDLGAWIGDNTIPWAMNVAAHGGTVYAIDPSPENCAFVRSVADLNGLTNVCIFITAVGDGITKELYTSDDLFHCSFMESGSTYISAGRTKLTACSLDELYAAGSISNIGYIHLDVEGMEHLVLQGATTVIDAFHPVITFEQHINTDDYRGLSRKLNNHGYIVYMINESLPGCRSDCRNFLCLLSPAPTSVSQYLSIVE